MWLEKMVSFLKNEVLDFVYLSSCVSHMSRSACRAELHEIEYCDALICITRFQSFTKFRINHVSSSKWIALSYVFSLFETSSFRFGTESTRNIAPLFQWANSMMFSSPGILKVWGFYNWDPVPCNFSRGFDIANIY